MLMKKKAESAKEKHSGDLRKRSDPGAKRPIIYISGESPLVERYAELCAARGYAVHLSPNESAVRRHAFASRAITMTNAVPPNASVAIELTNTDIAQKEKNLKSMDSRLPGIVLILATSLTVTATEQATWISQSHRLAGISVFPTLIGAPLVEVAPTIYSPKETLEAASRFFASLGKKIEIVEDRIGMVLPRILCQIINESAFAVTDDIALPQDIDTALKLGANFPSGPLEWADAIGLKQVCAVLAALQRDSGEERYRTAPLLKQMAVAGKWWK
jgi:3-hydroxybutyryl-CoA dehydrogenase